MKKAIAAAVMAVMLIVAAVLPANFSSVSAGKGNGTSARIKSLDELSDALTSFSDYLNGDGATLTAARSRSNAEPLAFEFEWPFPGNSNSANSKRYTSATMKLSTSAYVDSSSSYLSVSMSLEREMEMYLTEDATYFKSEGRMSTKTSYQGESFSSDIDFSMQFYVSDEREAIRIDRIRGVSGGVISRFPDRLVGVWIVSESDGDLANDTVSSLEEINRQNLAYLSLIGDYTARYDEDIFQKSSSSYKMDDDIFSEFIRRAFNVYGAGGIGYGTNFSGNFTVDLSDATHSKVHVDYKIKDSDNKAYEVSDFTFADFNNTVVKWKPLGGTISADRAIEIMEEELGD